MTSEFSLLLAVYAGDRSDYLERAFRSTVHEQQRRPGDVVIVQDGPVPEDLDTTLKQLIDSSPVPVQHLVLA